MKTKGATSYITLTLTELASIVGLDGKVEVRRKFVENLRKGNSLKAAAPVETTETAEAAPVEDKAARIQVTVKNWD